MRGLRRGGDTLNALESFIASKDGRRLVKQIDYSYPTSSNAVRFKFPNGCWTISFVEGCNPPVAMMAFPDRESAIAHALKITSVPWSKSFLFCHPEFDPAHTRPRYQVAEEKRAMEHGQAERRQCYEAPPGGWPEPSVKPPSPYP